MDDFHLDPDAQLMLEVKNGNAAAFNLLLKKYQRPIINFVFRFVYSRSEAEDIAQEVFLKAYRSAHNYVPTAKFSTWLFTIAKRLAINNLRDKSSHPTRSLEDMTEQTQLPPQFSTDGRETVLHGLEQQRLGDAVKRAIDALPEQQKIAVLLRRYEEFSYEEISNIMGCSVAAVKSLLSRAKVSLRHSLEYLITEQDVD